MGHYIRNIARLKNWERSLLKAKQLRNTALAIQKIVALEDEFNRVRKVAKGIKYAAKGAAYTGPQILLQATVMAMELTLVYGLGLLDKPIVDSLIDVGIEAYVKAKTIAEYRKIFVREIFKEPC